MTDSLFRHPLGNFDIPHLRRNLPNAVAVVFNLHATDPWEIYDWTLNWRSSQAYASDPQFLVIALRDNGGLSRESIQIVCDYERASMLDFLSRKGLTDSAPRQ